MAHIWDHFAERYEFDLMSSFEIFVEFAPTTTITTSRVKGMYQVNLLKRLSVGCRPKTGLYKYVTL